MKKHSHYCTRKTLSLLFRFIPDLDDIVSFEELIVEANLSPEAKDAAKYVFFLFFFFFNEMNA